MCIGLDGKIQTLILAVTKFWRYLAVKAGGAKI